MNDGIQAYDNVTMAAILAMAGVLLLYFGILAATNRLKRNYIAGMRTKTIMRNDETWRVAHKKCAWSIWLSGCILLVTALLLVALQPSKTAAIALQSVAVIVLVGAVQADRAAREVGK